jgi:type IV secretory pathway VirB10-like protein
VSTVRLALCLSLIAGCKEEAAKPASTEAATPVEVAPRAERRERPRLPDDVPDIRDKAAAPRGDRPRLPDLDEPRDWRDPELREERRKRREERRKEREAMLDTDGDGVVSDEERRQRFLPMHDRLDVDGDGKLTTAELEKSGRGFDVAAVDANGDGVISLEELEAAMRARREEGRSRWRGGRGRRGGD